MFGVVLTVLAAASLGIAAWNIGKSSCESDSEKRRSDRNISLVVIAIATMFLLCGLLSALTGWNPFTGITSSSSSSGSSMLL
jgi:F0F1-type ATP synthase membrane subunit c/vacuolar-type H+-ATPase subunit K